MSKKRRSLEDQSSIEELIGEALEIAREAGERILEVYEEGFEVSLKEDHTPLTTADLEAHKVIEKGLKAASVLARRLKERFECPVTHLRVIDQIAHTRSNQKNRLYIDWPTLSLNAACYMRH